MGTVCSCFAQHISRSLRTAGLNFYVTEPPPPGMDDEAAARRAFGVFSARYGNIYTARQLVQLMDRAFGRLDPVAKAWRRADGKFVDLFRPMIEPEGYATEAAVEAARQQHLAAVRRLFENVYVLVFTLGLTEAWRSKQDGCVLPVAPKLIRGDNSAEFEFVNFTAEEIAADIRQLTQSLRSINPRAKIILTVSPVPMVATYEDRHVLISNTYSKSALRVAAETACRADERACYFPSYEIITSPASRGRYFASNLRSVTPEGVDHVMRLFLRHFCARKPTDLVPGGFNLAPPEDVICDEERAMKLTVHVPLPRVVCAAPKLI